MSDKAFEWIERGSDFVLIRRYDFWDSPYPKPAAFSRSDVSRFTPAAKPSRTTVHFKSGGDAWFVAVPFDEFTEKFFNPPKD